VEDPLPKSQGVGAHDGVAVDSECIQARRCNGKGPRYQGPRSKVPRTEVAVLGSKKSRGPILREILIQDLALCVQRTVGSTVHYCTHDAHVRSNVHM
jgi:hypothetical protein